MTILPPASVGGFACAWYIPPCFSDQLAFHWAGSQWEYDAQHNSIITTGKGGTKPTLAAFTIFYNQGAEKYELEQTLQPDEQVWIDMGKLIREHVPDKNGKTLPADLNSGSFEFRDLTNKAIGTLFEGKVVYDKTYGHVTYGCSMCCGYVSAFLSSNPLGIPLLSTSGNGVDARDCAAQLVDVSVSFYGNWSTANTGIATVDYYGTHTGMSVGSTTSSTSGNLQSNKQTLQCPIIPRTPGGGVNVGPYRVEPIATPSQGPAICPTNQNGWSRNVTNQLQYINGAGYLVGGIRISDIITIGSTNQLGITQIQAGSHPTDSNGSWPDTYFVCSTACPTSGQTNALQTWTYNSLPLAHSNTVICKCTSITVDGY